MAQEPLEAAVDQCDKLIARLRRQVVEQAQEIAEHKATIVQLRKQIQAYKTGRWFR